MICDGRFSEHGFGEPLLDVFPRADYIHSNSQYFKKCDGKSAFDEVVILQWHIRIYRHGQTLEKLYQTHKLALSSSTPPSAMPTLSFKTLSIFLWFRLPCIGPHMYFTTRLGCIPCWLWDNFYPRSLNKQKAYLFFTLMNLSLPCFWWQLK